MKKMNWTEKYRPKKIEEIVGQTKFTEDARTWRTKGDFPNLLLAGRPGTGKTTASHVIGNEFLGDDKDSDFLEINASQDRKLETVRQTITNFVNYGSVSDNKIKIVLLDEIEGMTRDSQRALKRTMERATNVRFIITCNDVYGVDEALRSRCANYFFEPIDSYIVEDMLLEIAKKNDVMMALEDVETLVEISGGDMRRAINELQACIYSGKTPKNLHRENIVPYKLCIQNALDNKHEESLDFLNRLVTAGHSVKDICNKLLQSVLDMDIPHGTKFKVVALVGETEWRSRSVTPKVLVAWFVASIKQ
tara:strand:+ start:4125 stop:5042 length:918 start_codon:yes stop_codon:yes gene_type:complete